MEEVGAGGGCGQVIGRLVLYSERLRAVAVAGLRVILRVFPCMLQQPASHSATGAATGPYGQATGPFASGRSTKRGTTDTPSQPMCAARPTSAPPPNLCAATLPC